MTQADISAQTLDDLAALLSVNKQVSPAVLSRLNIEQDYLALVAFANQEWLTGALTVALKAKGYWHELPSQLQAYLEEIAGQFAQRNEQIKSQLSELAKVFAEQEIELLALKGSAYLFSGVVVEPAQRFMTDIDLLVPVEQLEKAKKAMATLGYKAVPQEQKLYGAHHHLPPYSKQGEVANIELHTKPVTRSAAQYFSAAQAWQHKVPLKLSSQTEIYQLSPNWQFLLQIIHSEMSDEGYYLRELNLRQLYTLVLVVKRYEKELDWCEIQAYCQQYGVMAIVAATLYQAHCLFGLKTPLTPKNLAPTNQTVVNQQELAERFEQSKGALLQRYQPAWLQGKGSALLQKYRRDYIVAKYGASHRYPYFSGCLKQLHHHFKMAWITLKRYCYQHRS